MKTTLSSELRSKQGPQDHRPTLSSSGGRPHKISIRNRNTIKISPKFIIILFVIIGSIVFWQWKKASQNLSTEIPLITAKNKFPIKVKPQEGLNPKLSHSDKMIYQELTDKPQGSQEAVLENLLALPEEPEIINEVPLKEIEDNQNSSSDFITQPDEIYETTNERLPEAMGLDAKNPSLATPREENKATLNIKHTPQKMPLIVRGKLQLEDKEQFLLPEEIPPQNAHTKAHEDSPPLSSSGSQEKMERIEKEHLFPEQSDKKIFPESNESKLSNTIAGKPSYWLQVGSLSSEKKANQELLRLKKHPAYKIYFQKANTKIQKVDFGENIGVYYRIYIGPFEKENTIKICNDLRKNKLGCIVTKL